MKMTLLAVVAACSGFFDLGFAGVGNACRRRCHRPHRAAGRFDDQCRDKKEEDRRQDLSRGSGTQRSHRQVPGSDVRRKVSYRRPIDDRAALSSADAFDSALRHPRAGRTRRVFITRTDSEKVLQHVKELVASGPFEPVVARERGVAAAPLLYDLINQMRGCDTAIIHVAGGCATGDAGSGAAER